MIDFRPAVRPLAAHASLALALLGTAPGHAQTAPGTAVQVPIIQVGPQGAYAADARFHSSDASFGPLGTQPILTSPASITVIPQDLLVDAQARTINDALRALPSVEIRDQQGLEVSRPQSRGFQGSITENTRLDGLNIIGTTAIPTENLENIQVLNGLAGALYGPETPAGVFNYVLKRPTDTPLARLVESYDSNGLFTEEADLGGRAGKDGMFGYRLDLVHGEGESFVSRSFDDRTLASGDFDIHVDDRTTIQLDASHYEDTGNGLPGSFVYDGASTSKTNRSTLLPEAVDATRVGYGQPGAGTNLVTDTGLAKLLHSFNDRWSLELGGLYQNAQRNLFGITNTLIDNRGDYTTTKNFTAVPHFTAGSNEAYLNGHLTIAGLENDVTLGTNGVINNQYNYRNSIVIPTLGKASLQNPVVFPYKPTPANGGEYESAYLDQQSIIEGDTLHLNRHWAVQTVFSESFLDAKSFSNKDKATGAETSNGLFSPTVSLIYRPTPRWTVYANYANAWEEGDQAPTNAANPNVFLAPYNDEQYEIGTKYAVTSRLLLTFDGFRMTRPYANTVTPSDVFQVIGTQRNYGLELFAQGDVTPGLSVLGGVTYIDARLLNTGVSGTDGGLVVGMPNWKSDMTLDWHPAFLHGFAFTGTAHYESERAATNVKNQSFAGSYATLDIGARYAARVFRRDLTVRVGAINVTDTRYYSSVADGTIVGSPGANTAYLGAPRTVLASVEVDL